MTRRDGRGAAEPTRASDAAPHQRREAHAVTPRRTPSLRARPSVTAAPLPGQLGWLAGSRRPHDFRPLDMSSCADCFGWRDDPRHPVVGGPVVGR